MIQIAVNLPDSLAALQRIKGIGKRLAERYGEELVTMVADYRRQHGIEAVSLPESATVVEKSPKKKEPGDDTKLISLEMFEKSMGITQIAQERGLAPATIEGHLAHFVEVGKLAIDLLVSSDKQQRIEKELARAPKPSLRDVKQALGADVSYGEIKLVQAHLRREAHSARSTSTARDPGR